MKPILILFYILLTASFSLSQNWSTRMGSNQENGLTKLTGPTTVTTPFLIASSYSSLNGLGTYTFGDKFVTSRKVVLTNVIVELRSLIDGSLIWEKTLGPASQLNAVGFTEDAVYAADYATHIFYALDVEDGSVLWSYPSDMLPVNEGICFAEDEDPIIRGVRLDRLTGQPKWINNYYIPVAPDAGYVVNKNGDIYYHWIGAINTDKKLIAIDINTGIIKYESFALPGDADQENDLVIGPDGTIYITRDCSGGSLWAFIDTGAGFEEKWHLSPGVTVESFGSDEKIYCINANNGWWGGQLLIVDGRTGVITDSSTIMDAQFVTVDYESTVYVSPISQVGKILALTPDLKTIKFELNIQDVS